LRDFLLLNLGLGVGGLGIGDWGWGIGDWAQSPIPNPQSPIPNPHFDLISYGIFFQFYFTSIVNLWLNNKFIL